MKLYKPFDSCRIFRYIVLSCIYYRYIIATNQFSYKRKFPTISRVFFFDSLFFQAARRKL